MITREIRAYLRGATAAKVLKGWTMIAGDPHRYYVVLADGKTHNWDEEQARVCALMLQGFGIEPLYRQSEPYLIS